MGLSHLNAETDATGNAEDLMRTSCSRCRRVVPNSLRGRNCAVDQVSLHVECRRLRELRRGAGPTWLTQTPHFRSRRGCGLYPSFARRAPSLEVSFARRMLRIEQRKGRE